MSSNAESGAAKGARKSPIEMTLDKVDWKPLNPFYSQGGGLPTATHEGVLELGGISIRCFQLSNGQRVILDEDLEKLFPGFKEVLKPEAP